MLTSVGHFFFGVLSFILMALGLSAAALWGLNWGFALLLGWTPFALTGTEILLGAILVFLALNRAAKEIEDDLPNR
jgi:hypothetical protein